MIRISVYDGIVTYCQGQPILDLLQSAVPPDLYSWLLSPTSWLHMHVENPERSIQPFV